MAINNLYHSKDPMLRKREKRYVWKPNNWHVAFGWIGWLALGWWFGVKLAGG